MLVAIFSLLAIIGFASFSFYLDDYAQGFGESFRLQNIILVEANETLELGNRLEATKKSGSVDCINGEISGHIFYHFGPQTCSANFTNRLVHLRTSGNSSLSIDFVIKLPWKVELAFIGFVLLNIIVALIVVIWIRSYESLKLNAQKELMNLAKQVAHDIRSPLSALNIVASTLNSESPEKRRVMGNALQRINDIANDLLKKGREPAERGDGVHQVPLTDLIERLVDEKRLQYGHMQKLKINIDIENQNLAKLSITANEKELSRALSNLINNSIEALPDQAGEVTIALSEQPDWVRLAVTDNGQGIPPQILEKIGEVGVSHGKNNSPGSGNGLGVFHAKKTMEQLGGKFLLSSKLNEGTVAELLFRKI